MAIQLRRGEENDLKTAQLVPGELAVATDTKKILGCFTAGTAEQIYPGIESGSNENGSYIKFPDGTMIVSIRETAQVSESKGIVCTFPQKFVNSQYAIFANILLPYDYIACAEGNDPSASNVWIYDLTGGSVVGEWIDYTVMAIGRYK